MQIYGFSLIFHSISELNKEKKTDFANFSADNGRKIISYEIVYQFFKTDFFGRIARF